MKFEHRDSTFILTFEEADQVLNTDFLANIGGHLDEVEAADGKTALVLTGEGKTFHQGLDLPFIGGLGDGLVDFLKSVHQLFGRLHRLPVPTIAALNGHAIAAGAMLTQCADVRIMRSDRGWYRLPEVELQMPFTIVMQTLLEGRLPQPAMHRLMVLGERMGGQQALDAGVVDAAVEGEEGPLQHALLMAPTLAATAGPSIQTIRTGLYRPLLRAIESDAGRADLMEP